MTETLQANAALARVLSVRDRFLETAEIIHKAANSLLPTRIADAAAVISSAFETGHKLLVFGNGGSDSDAQHLCGELVVRFQMTRRPLPAFALCSDAAVMTACGNDFSYDQVFERQIDALGRAGDVGTRNQHEREFTECNGLSTILMTGPHIGTAAIVSDIVLAAPGPNTARVQELDLASYHAICELIEQHLFGEVA